MPLFDSNEELHVAFDETAVTGSASNKRALLIAGVTPSNTASFLKMDEDGSVKISGFFSASLTPSGTQQITGSVTVNSIASPVTVNQGASGSIFWKVTGSVGIAESVPLTIGSFSANVTASVKIVATEVTQSVTGSLFVFNNPATPMWTTGSQFIFNNPSTPAWVSGTVGVTSVASPVTVIQGASGSIPWKVTDTEEATFIAYVSGVALGNNKSMLSIVNTGNFTVRIQEIRITNVQISAVTGIAAIFWFVRITGHSGGTLQTPLPFDTNDSLDSGITTRTGATVTGEAPVPLFRKRWSSDDWAPGRLDVEALDHAFQEVFPMYSYQPKMKPITLRQNQGLSIKHVVNSTAGTFDISITFTQV